MIEFSEDFLYAWKHGMMSHVQYSWIARSISGKKTLVFGAGNDAALWHRLGATIAESDPKWVKEGITRISIAGKVGVWIEESPPPVVINQEQECVIVDSPKGYNSDQVGRQMTIYWASLLTSKIVFVHDYQRPWERACCDKYLGQPDVVFTAKKGDLAVFYRDGKLTETPALRGYKVREDYYDHLGENYNGIMGRPSFPQVTAWTHALTWLENNPQTWQQHGAMMVEDDCAATPAEIYKLFHDSVRARATLGACWIANKNTFRNWVWDWARDFGDNDDNWKSFNPICYLSPALLRAIFEYRESRKAYAFHEILFPTLAARMGGLLMDWRQTNHSDFGTYRYRPSIKNHELGKITHPVKSQLEPVRSMTVWADIPHTP